MKNEKIATLFLDIGGVLLTNGWGKPSRKLAVAHFNLDPEETEERHHLTFDTYEMGKLSLDEYLNRVVFYEHRDFSKEDFRSFMFEQSKPLPGSIDFFSELKAKHKLSVIAVNNEGRELNEYRIRKYKLDQLFDAFASSCYMKLRKPDVDIFHMACDIAQTLPHHAMMVDDRMMFVDVAKSISIHGLHFDELKNIKEKIKEVEFKFN